MAKRTYVLYSGAAGGIIVTDPTTAKRVYIDYGSFVVDTGPAAAAGHADGQATVVGIPMDVSTGRADGFATAQAFLPSHGNADGFASVYGESGNVAKAAGTADGFANVIGFSGQPATGHADGFANVFSTPGGRKTGAAWLLGF